MDRIELNKLQIFAHHGVMPQEQVVGNLFEVTLHVCGDFAGTMESDDIARGISYYNLFEIVNAEMAVPSKTLEHVAFRIRQSVTRRFPEITSGMVQVAKLTPPFPARIESAAFTHSWGD